MLATYFNGFNDQGFLLWPDEELCLKCGVEQSSTYKKFVDFSREQSPIMVFAVEIPHTWRSSWLLQLSQDHFYSVDVGAIEACALAKVRLPDWSP